MTTEVVQQDFGGFNPRFPGGVGITLGSVEAYRVFADYMEPAGEGANGAGSLAEIAVKSVLEHEVRHYHDALLSPWGSFMLRLRMQALINGVQAIRVAGEVPGDSIPLPIARWLALGEDDRRKYVRDWGHDLGEPLDPLELPTGLAGDVLAGLAGTVADLSELDLQSQLVCYTAATVGAYDGIRRLVAGHPPAGAPAELRPAMVFEVAALAVQIESIRQSQGLVDALRFLDLLFESERPYAKLWRLFTKAGLLLARAGHPDRDDAERIFAAQGHVLRMATWALLGNQQLDGAEACPTRRFGALVEHLVRHHTAPETRAADAGEAWDTWDVATGSRPWRDGCRESLEGNRRTLRQYEAMAGVWKGGDDVPRLVLNLIGSRVADQEAMMRQLFDDPNQLTEPSAYLNAAPGTFSLPCLRIELEGFAVPAPARDAPGYRAVRVVDTEDGRALTSYAISLGGAAGGEALDDLLAFESLMCACDLAFSEHTMPWPAFERSRDVVESITDKRVVLIV